MRQRDQRLFVVLARALDLVHVAAVQRPQRAIAPAGLVGDEDDPACIADQQRVAALAPFALKLGELQLDHHRAEKLGIVAEHRAGQKIAGDAAGHAHRIKAPAALSAGLAEVRTKTVVVADVTARQAPVAGGHREAAVIKQLEG